MDLKALIANNRHYTLHSHTQYCDGRASMAMMAKAAVQEGLEIYGFSPHSPLCIDSPCNMSANDVSHYLAEAKQIAEEYATKCRFLIGMEIDYLNTTWGPAIDYFQELPLDYRIGSVHFIPSQDGEFIDIDGSSENFKQKMENHFHRDIDYVVETFYAQSRAMLQSGGFDILGHFDKVGLNASSYAPGIESGSHYQALLQDFIEHIIASDVIVELNTKAYQKHQRFFPGKQYLPNLVDAGVRIAVNSDAHTTDGITASYSEAYKLLDYLGYR